MSCCLMFTCLLSVIAECWPSVGPWLGVRVNCEKSQDTNKTSWWWWWKRLFFCKSSPWQILNLFSIQLKRSMFHTAEVQKIYHQNLKLMPINLAKNHGKTDIFKVKKCKKWSKKVDLLTKLKNHLKVRTLRKPLPHRKWMYFQVKTFFNLFSLGLSALSL